MLGMVEVLLYYILLGNVLSELNKYDDAMVCYLYIIKIDPKNSDAWNGKGKLIVNYN